MDVAAVAVTPWIAATTPKNAVPVRVAIVLFMLALNGIDSYFSVGPYGVLPASDWRFTIIHAVASNPPTAAPTIIHASNGDMSNSSVAPQIAAPTMPPLLMLRMAV